VTLKIIQQISKVKMTDENENTDEIEEAIPKKKKKVVIPWNTMALYGLPAAIIFLVFIVMYNVLVQEPPSRDEIKALLTKNENKVDSVSVKEEKDTKDAEPEGLEQGSDIPFIGPQHYYHSFTGALATDLRNNSGILTIEIAVSIYMGQLNADKFFEGFKDFEPALRSALLTVMRTRTKEEVEDTKGKKALNLEMLKAINNELEILGAKPEIKTVQFTQFLLI
jgi:flagellar basal body-associated protein FliL